MTASAERFVGPDTFAALTGEPVHTSLWEEPGEVLHVRSGARGRRRRRRAGHRQRRSRKLAHGLADDLLTSTLLEATCPLVRRARDAHRDVGAPRHRAATCDPRGARRARSSARSSARSRRRRGDRPARRARGDRARPSSGASAAAGTSPGGGSSSPPGPTHEPIDPVRFLGNRSSGKMGVAVAAEASRAARDVTLVLGPGHASRRPGRARAARSRPPRRCATPSSRSSTRPTPS